MPSKAPALLSPALGVNLSLPRPHYDSLVDFIHMAHGTGGAGGEGRHCLMALPWLSWSREDGILGAVWFPLSGPTVVSMGYFHTINAVPKSYICR